MSDGLKNGLKFALAMFVFITGVCFVVEEDAAQKSSYLMMLLLFLGIVAAFLLLRAYYAAKIRKRQRQPVPDMTQNKNRQQFPQTYRLMETGSRDGERRLEQLDSFLQNGIIDKKEYAALKKKYQGRG